MGTSNSLASYWCTLATALQSTSDDTWLSEKDLHRVTTRSSTEGIGFLTKTCPALAKCVYASFQSNKLDISGTNFNNHRASAVPVFLNGLFRKIYSNDGTLREEADPQHIKYLLQLLGMFYKLESSNLPEEGKELVTRKFLATQIRVAEKPFVTEPVREYDLVMDQARKLVWQVLEGHISKERWLAGGTVQACDPLNAVPRHGPGSTACRTKQPHKWNIPLRFSSRINKVFPYEEFAFASWSHFCDSLYESKPLATTEVEHLARVTFVPKNADAPRLISMEQRELQYMQQGLMRLLYNHVERHPLTRGRVNFRDQSINQDMSWFASVTGQYATLDLSEASDSVTTDLVTYLFPPRWVEALLATRSDRTELPDGRVVELNSFAPMGSAVCFPVEALCFWALAQACSNLGSKDPVFVYGDDILCNTEDTSLILRVFEMSNLLINKGKSYWQGPFRESCGSDWFNGVNVTPIRFRKTFKKKSPSHLASNIGFVNQIYEQYGSQVALDMSKIVEEVYGFIPRVQGSQEPLFFHFGMPAANDVFLKRRWNPELHYFEYKVRSLRSKTRQHGFDGWGEVARHVVGRDCYLKRGEYTNPNSLVTNWSWKELR